MDFVSEKKYEFSEFRLEAENCVLLDGENRVVDLTPKALQILCVLVENAGNVVSKEELIRRVWTDSFVEEANLSHHIFRIRKALGENENQKFIETVPKRGYRFVAQVGRAKIEPPKAEPISIQNPAVANIHRPLFGGKSFVIFACAFAVFLAIGIFFGQRYWRSEPVKTVPTTAASSPQTQPASISRVTNIGKVAAATVSPDGKFVAYVQNYTSGEGTLYVRQVETNTEMKLLQPDERIFGTVSFSPDSAFIYFIAYDKRDPRGALHRIPVLGGEPTKVLPNVKLMFNLSPEGKRAAFYRFDAERKQTNIVSAAVDGSGEEKTILTLEDDEKAVTGVPAFSPDNRLISFGLADNQPGTDFNQPQFSLFTVDLQTGATNKLSEEKWTEIGKTAWMPDGSGLVFVGKRPRAGNQIYFLAVPSGELRRVTKELNSYGNYGLGITADGATLVADLWESTAQLWKIDADGANDNLEQLTTGISDGANGLATLGDGGIVYTTRNGDDFDLWTLNEKSGKREGKPLTSDAFYENEVCAAPDDSFLVFSSNRAGNQHLFRMNRDDFNVAQLTFGDSYDAAPDCSARGNWIVYQATNGGKTVLWKIPATGGAPIQLTDFECLAPSVSPDAANIACIEPSASQVKPAILTVISAEGGERLKTFPVVPFGWYYRAPRWTPGGDALVFYNTINLIGNLWKQNLAGGAPIQMTDFKSEIIFNHAYTRDGKRLVISRGRRVTDVVAIKNFKSLI